MLNFSVPLYIQIIQGRTPIETAIAMLPFNLTVFFTAMLVVRLYDKMTPRRIGQIGFVLCTVALLWLAWVVRNDWSAPVVMIGLIVFGIGQGALVTLVFNVLVTAAPKELAGDVGSLRGTTQNLAAGVGTAIAGALLVGLLSSMIMYQLADNPRLPAEVQAQIDLDNINFVTNDRLLEVMQATTATPEQVEEAVRINTESRLRALKIGLLLMAGVALLAIFPASRLPDYKPGEIRTTPSRRPRRPGIRWRWAIEKQRHRHSRRPQLSGVRGQNEEESAPCRSLTQSSPASTPISTRPSSGCSSCCRIKSISTDPAYAADCRACADWHVADLAEHRLRGERARHPGPSRSSSATTAARRARRRCSTATTTCSRWIRSSSGTTTPSSRSSRPARTARARSAAAAPPTTRAS